MLSAFIGLAVVSWAAHLTMSRWNGTPSVSTGGLDGMAARALSIDAALDRSTALTTALNTLPALPKFVLPPAPEGMKWVEINMSSSTIDVSDATYGEWTPETRPNQQCVVAYLESPAVETSLALLAAVGPGVAQLPPGSMTGYRNAARMFVTRTRLNHAGRGDIPAAFADLAAVYRLATMGMKSADSGLFLSALACESIAGAELRRMAFEHALPLDEVRSAIRMLRASTLDKEGMWRCVVMCQCETLEHLLDRTYTDDGSGDGWLVLSHVNDILQPRWADPPRTGAWNALSIFFNSRRTVESKIDQFRIACEEAGKLPYAEARMAVQRIKMSELRFTLLDGPLCSAKFASSGTYHRLVVSELANRNANFAALGLSAWRHDHGVYPASLDELLDGYLESLPQDPYCESPIRYRRLGEGDDYVLYSVGPNGIDDGGVEPSRRAGVAPEDRDGDLVFGHTRPDPSWDYALEPVAP